MDGDNTMWYGDVSGRASLWRSSIGVCGGDWLIEDICSDMRDNVSSRTG